MDEVFPEPPDDAPFWRRLKWHMQRGTRPPCQDSHRGRWTNTDLGGAVRLSGQAVGRWITEHDHLRTLPTDPNNLENKLFGAKPDQDDAWYATQRRKFRSALALAQADADRKKIVRSQATRNDISGVLGPKAALPVAFASAPTFEASGSVTNIAIRAPRHFLGRQDLMHRMREALTGSSVNGYAPPAVALHGLRGVGKTALAAAYAELYRDAYRIIWWIDAANTDTIRSGLLGLGTQLGWISRDVEDDLAVEQIMQRLRTNEGGILLIYDDAGTPNRLRPHLPPTGRAQIIVTSNYHAWGSIAAPIEVDMWPPSIGAEYLIRRVAGRGDQRQHAKALALALGGLPLAIEQAAAYCERLHIDFTAYHDRFDGAPLRMLDAKEDASPDYNAGRTVAKTFALAIEELQNEHSSDHNTIALFILSCAALVAPNPVPLYLLRESCRKSGHAVCAERDVDGLDQAVAALRAFGLVTREDVPDEREPRTITACIRVHRLVALVVLERTSPDAMRTAIQQLTGSLSEIYPADVMNDVAAWPRARRLNELVTSLIKYDIDDIWDQKLCDLITSVAAYKLKVSANYDLYLNLIKYAAERNERSFGRNSLEFAKSLNDVGVGLYVKGNLSGARDGYERGMQIVRDVGYDTKYRRFTATALHYHMALLLDAEGDQTGARAMFERALALCEQHLDRDDLELARIYSSPGDLLLNAGEYEAAKSLYDKALAIRESLLGPDHPAGAETLHGLARLLDHLDQREEAAQYYERALRIREVTLDWSHPDIAANLADYGKCLLRAGKTTQARTMLERAVAIFEMSPDWHPLKTVAALRTLSELLTSYHEKSAAAELSARALAIYERHHLDDLAMNIKQQL